MLPSEPTYRDKRASHLGAIREAAASGALVFPGEVITQISRRERDVADVTAWLSDLREIELDKGPEVAKHFPDSVMYSIKIIEEADRWGAPEWYMHVSITNAVPHVVTVRSFKPDGSPA